MRPALAAAAAAAVVQPMDCGYACVAAEMKECTVALQVRHGVQRLLPAIRCHLEPLPPPLDLRCAWQPTRKPVALLLCNCAGLRLSPSWWPATPMPAPLWRR